MGYRKSAKPVPCSSCLKAYEEGVIRAECIQPLPEEIAGPIDYDGNPWCHDCSAASTLSRLQSVLTWEMARTAVGNDRQEQLRLPGTQMGLVMMGLVRPSKPGDLEKHHAWLNSIDLEPCHEYDQS